MFRTAGASTAAVCGDRYERAYNKALQVSFDELSEFERAFPATPLWNYRNELVPTQTVQKPLNIPDERWFEGTWIVAAQGRGKTNLLRHLALSLPQDACFIFMDAKGELIDGLSPLEAYRDRLVPLEPNPQYPLAITRSISAVIQSSCWSTYRPSRLVWLMGPAFRQPHQRHTLNHTRPARPIAVFLSNRRRPTAIVHRSLNFAAAPELRRELSPATHVCGAFLCAINTYIRTPPPESNVD